MKLDTDSRETMQRRINVGIACLEAAQPVTWEEDQETAAADAISDILTAIYGPAGAWDYQGAAQNEAIPTLAPSWTITQAEALLERARRSWLGDAEDYITAPERAPLPPCYPHCDE